jgi:WD40 repeat protein
MGDSQVPMVCDHNIDASQNNSRSKDVTTLDWSPDGELLATGCYDGWARVFSKTGAAWHRLCDVADAACDAHAAGASLHAASAMLQGSSPCHTPSTWLLLGDLHSKVMAYHHQLYSNPCNQHLQHALGQHTRRPCRPCTAGSHSHALACHPSPAAGELVRVLKKHTGPIFSLKWNKKGTCLLSGSVDRTAILWDAKSGEVQQQWQLHNGEQQG